MELNPFGAVAGYPRMLNKIGIWTFIVCLGATWLLRKQSAPLDNALANFDLPVTIQGVPIAIGYLIPALAIALPFRIFKMHDLISDAFGIRSNFDIREILIPMAGEAGVAVPFGKLKRIAEQRDDLMIDVFYRYASGTKGKAVIDEQMITMALDQWSWFWMLLETAAITLLCALALILFGKGGPAACLFMIFIILLLLMRLILPLCANYAHREVKAIVEDGGRRSHVRQVLSAL
jgi:hypothetical protein